MRLLFVVVIVVLVCGCERERLEWEPTHEELKHLKTLSDKQARHLSHSWHSGLHLPGLTRLTDEQAEALAKLTDAFSLDLRSITSLSDAQCRAFANRESVGVLSLDGLTSLSDAQAAILAKYRGKRLSLSLSNLTKLSPAARSLLEAKPSIQIYVPRAPPRPARVRPQAVL